MISDSVNQLPYTTIKYVSFTSDMGKLVIAIDSVERFEVKDDYSELSIYFKSGRDKWIGAGTTALKREVEAFVHAFYAYHTTTFMGGGGITWTSPTLEPYTPGRDVYLD